MTDIRMYCSPSIKKRIKVYCAQNRVTINDLIRHSLEEMYPELLNDLEEYKEELGMIKSILATEGWKMDVAQRESLKSRKKELQKIISKQEDTYERNN